MRVRARLSAPGAASTFHRGLLAWALLALIASAAHADVGDYLGKPVASVRLSVEGRESRDARLLLFVDPLLGRPLSMLDVRQSVVHLYSTGRFEDVQVRAANGAGGVTLHYELVPAHPVERLQLTGSLNLPGIDEGRLRRAIVDRYGALPSAARAPEVARLLEQELRQRGYLRAAVSPQITIEHSPDRSTLTLAVAAGARAHIGSTDVTGSPGVAAKELIDRLGLAAGTPYEVDTLAARIDEYLRDQRGRGYLEARVTPAVKLADDDRLAHVSLNVVPGPRVRVVFTGDALPANRRDELVPIAREGSADEDLLEDASNAIEEYLHALGFRDATAPFARQESDGELIITFTIKRGPEYRIASVEVMGNAAIARDAIDARVRLRAGQPFASAVLEADLDAIEELYRRSGFALARAQPVIAPAPGSPADSSQMLVTVAIQIAEGVQTLIGSVRVDGNGSVPENILRDGLGLQPGRPFYLTQMAVDRDAIQLQYANRGYPSATVEGNPGLSADGSRADVVFTVHEGPRIVVDHILIAGNTRTRTETIERELQLKPGAPLGLDAVIESQRRLAALGLFRRARISELAHGEETSRDLLVTVEETPATTVGFGGGLEVGQRVGSARTDRVASERIEAAPRAFFEIGRRNLFGKNRSVNLFTRISLRPRDAAAGEPSGAASGYGFSEYRVLGTFREPRVLDSAAEAFLTATVEQQRRSSFNFARRAFSAELARRLSPSVSVGGNYQIQRTELFDETIDENDRLLVDRLFPQLRLSSFSSSIVRDTRDDALNPADGRYFSANVQLAARSIGSQVGFAKSYLTAQLFRRVPRTRPTVFAASARVGTGVGFARDIPLLDALGNSILDAAGRPIVEAIKDLPASERFFAGGDTTVRGFALDQLGTPETIDQQQGFPKGGNAVVILNGELRAPVFGGFGVVGFIDTGNVFARTADFSVGQLRTAVGFGIRYRSPVGPIRIDVGFKVNRKELVPGTLESRKAFHITLGQAF
jgi:outer membrane protein assembly complex protein YaeT